MNSVNLKQEIFISPENTPFSFRIILNESYEDQGYTFEVSLLHAGKEKHCLYHLPGKSHTSWLNFFQQLSKDFGLRLPQNRQPPANNIFHADYQVLLTKNLHPEMRYGYGDPAILRVDEGGDVWYYLLVTSNDAPDSFPVCRSKDLINWDFVTFVFPKNKKPPWAADGDFISDYWAPEMHRIGDEYRIYFVAREKQTLELCIGVARSYSPLGPFLADKEPLLKKNQIDPHVFVINDAAFLYWKEDNNAVWPHKLTQLLYHNPDLISTLFREKEDQLTASFIIALSPWLQRIPAMEAFQVQQSFIEAVTQSFASFKSVLKKNVLDKQQLRNVVNEILHLMKTPVYAQKLTADGSGLTGEKKLIMENDLEWEAHLIEGIWITRHQNKYYLFYSANDFSTDKYGIGVAIGETPLGPFKKMDEPFLKSTKNWWAPGHPSVAMAPDGHYRMFLHAYFPYRAGYKAFRALLSIPIRFKEDTVTAD